MIKLVSDYGRWAIKDNSMIFGNVVWCGDKEDVKLYHLIDENGNTINVNNENFIQYE